jgi:hypothetical protein
MKKLLTVLLSVFFLLVGATLTYGADLIEADESFAMPNDVALGLHGVVFTDQDTMQVASWLMDQDLINNPLVDPTCDGIEDSRCQSTLLSFISILPICKDSADINCLSEIGAVKSDGNRVEGKFESYFPLKAENGFTGNAEYHLPSGTSGALFTLPNVSHKGGDKYFASFKLTGSVNKSKKTSTLGSFEARITPVQLQSAPRITGSCGDGTACPNAGWAFNKVTKTWGGQASGFDGEHSCVATSAVDSMCAQRFSFPENTRFYLKARVNLSPTGWLHGRIADPNLEFSESGGITTIAIEALPVRVPTVYKSFMWPDLPEYIKSKYDASTGRFSLGSSGGFTRQPGSMSQTDPLKRNFISEPASSSPTGIEELKAWLPAVSDKATAVPSMWSVRTLREDELNGANSCFRSDSKVTGIVSTNSTQYSPGPPEFDKQEGSLVYKVAAPHFSSNGDVFKGRYNLVIRSDIARCIYGFSKAPIKAELSIVSADGTPQIATTVLGESNGWVSLSAQNFEFSAPVIKAKLSQEAEVVVTPTPTPTPSASAKPVVKTVTITCIKGKTSKKVTAVNPKCPAGYKKK